MLRTADIVGTVSRELARRYERDGEDTELVDGTQARIHKSPLGGYVLEVVAQEGEEPDIYLSAMCLDEVDYLGSTRRLHVFAGDDAYTWRRYGDTLPDWAVPILQNIVETDLL